MELLIVGIDGGTAEIFDAFDMPFWAALRGRDRSFDVTEDLIQRGWARMLSGQGSEVNGALYMRPVLGKPQAFETTYNYKMMSATPGFAPIWQLAEQAGQRIGIMNVPTTSPAQAVGGFYVSGGGGGMFQGGLPDDAVYPAAAKSVLLEENYIFDTRLGAEGFPTADAVCSHIEMMMKARTRSFIRLAKQQDIGFGFLAYRATTVLFYLAMSEISHVLQRHTLTGERQSWSGGWLGRVERHLKVLDDCLAELFDELQPKNHILTSDHSMVPWTHNVDFNGFLADAGYGEFRYSKKQAIKNANKLVSKKRYRSQLKDVPLGRLSAVLGEQTSLTDATRAFSGWYVQGIYVNDRSRFGGPVADQDVRAAVAQMVDDFNWHAKRHHLAMTAAPYRETFGDAPEAGLLPDVTILQDGHAFPSALGSNWYTPNPNFAPVESVVGVGGMHSGQKGRHPILMANTELAALKNQDDPQDLRLVYQLTKHLFAGKI